MGKEIKGQPLPKWFTGQLYDKGGKVTNPFSGYSYELEADELSMYDFIMGSNYLMERGQGSVKMQNEFYKGLDWFRRSNAEAYMILLD
mgnify:FL=1